MARSEERRVHLQSWRRRFAWSRLLDSAFIIVASLLSAALIFAVLYDFFDSSLRRWADRDLARRAHLIGIAVDSQARNVPAARLQGTLDRLAASEDAANLLVCSPRGATVAGTGLAAGLDCRSQMIQRAIDEKGASIRGTVKGRGVAVTAHATGTRTLFVVQDRTFLDARRRHFLQLVFVFAEVVLLALLLLARAGLRIGRRRTAQEARSVIQGMRTTGPGTEPVPPELRLLVREVHDTVEQHRTQPAAPLTGAERLRAMVGAEIPAGGLVVIANREPYAHERDPNGEVVVQRPASGLVTGIEPILRACGGTWLAYGGGSADRENSDSSGRVAVPPDSPEYTLRRMWVDGDEYERYYSGFANEGLWPLCHIAHTQPSFRAADWASYQSVNETFARAAVEESGPGGLVLIQDYHFALVPRLIREQDPHVVTSLFWHIPWPNSEVVGICPWKETLLQGMLGADIVGFHTRQYCLNFLESVQRYLECRVDLDEMSVSFGGRRTLVRPYPISVEWPHPVATRMEGALLRRSLGIGSEVHVSVGVDRADYTKGLLERIAAIETLLEDNPSLAGRYMHVQLASPTRTRIRRYQVLADDLQEAVDRVNERFGTAAWKPILLQMRTFSPEEVRVYYAMADSALVTPLHDGMNLVAKEYAASCSDGDGALVLSVFAGAAKELQGALIVNPYDSQQVAQAILRAIRMPLAERKARMEAMRAQIASSSIYDWSERLLTDMWNVRQEEARFWPRRKSPAAGPLAAAEVAAG